MPTIRTSIFYKLYKKGSSEIANFLNDKITESFFVIGVTGTNGKSTTTNLIGHIMNENISDTLIISSLYSKIKNEIIPHKKKWEDFTIFDIYDLMSTAKNNGCQIVVIEMSGAGLRRLAYEGLEFDAGVLTNISHDHVSSKLSFHDYANSKKELFKNVLRNSKANKFAVLPKDDKLGRKWFEEMPFDKKINYSASSTAVLKAENIQKFLNGTVFDFNYLGRTFQIKTPLLGSFNVENILAAMGLAFQIGLEPEQAIASIQKFRPLQGRMERISHENKHYYFDIAHSPDALDKTLQFLANVKGAGRTIVVFGSPGDKDKEKRTQIGKIIERYADIMIASDSEPGHENRLQILDDLTAEVKNKKEGENFFVIPERKFALQFAIEIAQPNDLILFTGRPRHGMQKTNVGKKEWDDMGFVKEKLGIA